MIKQMSKVLMKKVYCNEILSTLGALGYFWGFILQLWRPWRAPKSIFGHQNNSFFLFLKNYALAALSGPKTHQKRILGAPETHAA